MSFENDLRDRLRRAFGVDPDTGMEDRILAAGQGAAATSRRLRLSPAGLVATAVAVLAIGGGSLGLLSGFNRAPSNGPAPADPGRVAQASPSAEPGPASPSPTPRPAAASPSVGWVSPRATAISHPMPSPTVHPTPHTTPTPMPSPSGNVLVLTNGSGGQTFTVTPGEHVQAVLTNDMSGYTPWSTPQSQDVAVLKPTGTPCAAPSNATCTDFVSLAAGSSQLTSQSDPYCHNATPPCGAPARAWIVTVNVS